MDPVLDTSNPQQMQGYTYANNNPVTYADPSSLRRLRLPIRQVRRRQHPLRGQWQHTAHRPGRGQVARGQTAEPMAEGCENIR
ncbi:hypothetical protein V5P93_003003 [Actinokineospora auranticolor]|uniref:hypothetical protein n=1 Tax=Actinokineospora auranticolor TaxID=155976 RepID=UPI001FE57CC2|nr:hypothetical protein [Actinokineospora auranticolor]